MAYCVISVSGDNFSPSYRALRHSRAFVYCINSPGISKCQTYKVALIYREQIWRSNQAEHGAQLQMTDANLGHIMNHYDFSYHVASCRINKLIALKPAIE